MSEFLQKPNALLLDGTLDDVKKGSFPEQFYEEGMKWFTENYQQSSKFCINY